MHLKAVHTQKEQQHAVFRQVFEQYHAALCSFAARLVGDRMEAEDIVEDVFIKLWQKEPDFGQYRNMKALLYIAVKNACLSHLKHQKTMGKRQDGFGYLQAGGTEGFALLEMVRSEVLRELYTELQKLPEGCRKVMHLVFVEGWGHQKIADHLGVAVTTVKTQKSRGISALRKAVDMPVLLLLLPMLSAAF